MKFFDDNATDSNENGCIMLQIVMKNEGDLATDSNEISLHS